jgi:hypothetical protein
LTLDQKLRLLLLNGVEGVVYFSSSLHYISRIVLRLFNDFQIHIIGANLVFYQISTASWYPGLLKKQGKVDRFGENVMWSVANLSIDRIQTNKVDEKEKKKTSWLHKIAFFTNILISEFRITANRLLLL